jgi:putative ABC transport system permease protein
VLARFLETQLFGVDARDVPTYATVAILLVAAAIAGCLVPATRATRVNPMVSLRAD